MKGKKYTFVEFVAAQEGDSFNEIEEVNLRWAENYIKSLTYLADMVHEGDCTKENMTCGLCLTELLLQEYKEYYFKKENI